MRVACERLAGGETNRQGANVVRRQKPNGLERMPARVVVVEAGLETVDVANQRIRLGRMQAAA